MRLGRQGVPNDHEIGGITTELTGLTSPSDGDDGSVPQDEVIDESEGDVGIENECHISCSPLGG